MNRYITFLGLIALLLFGIQAYFGVANEPNVLGTVIQDKLKDGADPGRAV
jgi:hypothetical protein